MSAALYQTSADLQRQRVLANRLEEAWGCTIVMSSDPIARVDAFAYKAGRVVAAIELKCKTGSVIQYGDYIHVDVEKVNALIYASMEHFQCRALFVVQYQEGVFFVDVKRLQGVKILKGRGRKDRNDVHDSDDAYQVPLRLVRRVQTGADDDEGEAEADEAAATHDSGASVGVADDADGGRVYVDVGAHAGDQRVDESDARLAGEALRHDLADRYAYGQAQVRAHVEAFHKEWNESGALAALIQLGQEIRW